MHTLSLTIFGSGIQVLPDMDAPPPAPWGGGGDAPDREEPQPEDRPVPVQEPWAGENQPIRDPSSPAQRWRLH